MTKILNKEDALLKFENSARMHTDATELGDYKKANKNYKEITDATHFLKMQDSIHLLNNFLNSPSTGVRLWAATYILTIDENKGIGVLEEIAKRQDIHSLTARTIINEWRNGNLKL